MKAGKRRREATISSRINRVDRPKTPQSMRRHCQRIWESRELRSGLKVLVFYSCRPKQATEESLLIREGRPSPVEEGALNTQYGGASRSGAAALRNKRAKKLNQKNHHHIKVKRRPHASDIQPQHRICDFE